MGREVNPGISARREVRWTPVVAGAAVVVAGVLPGFLTASLAPRIGRDFSFGESGLGLAIALFYIVSALASSLAGGVVERVGTTRALRLGGASSAACCLAVVLLAHSTASITALLLVGGIGNALAGPSVAALLRSEIDPGRQGFAFGVQQSGAPIGSLLAGLALPAVAIPFGWRWAFVAGAGLALLGSTIAARSSRGSDGAASTGRGERAGPRTGAAFARVLALSAGLASVSSVGLISFLVLYAVDSGMSEGHAGLVLAAASVLATASRIGFGALGDRARWDPLVIVAAMLVAAAAGLLVLIVATPLAVAVGALIALGVGWGWAGPMTLAAVRRSPESAAWVVGVMMSGLFAGAVAGPAALGILAGRDMFAAAWSLCAACAVGAAAAALVARRLR